MPKGIYKRSKKIIDRLMMMNKSRIGKKRPPFSDECKRHMSESKRGEKNHMFGKKRPPFSKEWMKHMSECKIGELSWNWKGGISTANEKLRHNREIRLWKKSVFERDNFICQKYGISGGILIAHHINNFSDYPELRTSIENGITFSEKAHLEFHKIYGYKNNTKEQMEEFLKNPAR